MRKQTYTPKCHYRFTLFIEIALYIVGVGLLFQFFFVPHALRSAFDSACAERLIISSNNSESYDTWKENTCDDTCGIQLFYYYLFNTTNPDDVLNGAYPKLTEIGPFIFNRYELRRDVSFKYDHNHNEIVTYKYEYQYILNESLMDPQVLKLWNHTTWNTFHNNTITPYPPINMVNPFGLALLALCRNGKQCSYNSISVNCCQLIRTATDGFSFSLFTAKQNPTFQIILQDGLHSNLAMINETKSYIDNSTVYVSEYTGQGNKNKMRQLIYFGDINETQSSFWNGPVDISGCREPKQWAYKSLKSVQTIRNVWLMDKYRPVQLIENGTITVGGINIMKYVIDPKEYKAAKNASSTNWKYYQHSYDGRIKLNLYDGLLNLTSTNGRDAFQFNSKPYFLDAPYYRDNLNEKMGLRMPNRSIDDTFFAIDTDMGTTFSSYLASQISVGIYPCASSSPLLQCPNFQDIPTLIVPQFYVIVKGIPPAALLYQYKQMLDLLDVSTQLAVYFGPAAAFACFVVAFYLSFKRICKCWKRNLKRQTLYMDEKDDPNTWSLAYEADQNNEMNFSQNQTMMEESDSDNDINCSDEETEMFAKRDEDQMDVKIPWANNLHHGDKQTSALLTT